ncbi:response regulator [Shewanella sp. SNU WT4]|uniref:ATP-binding protein n=1 Tax=Shewanella sp. SNU WT4 TaxID=2590015 RepID=UPI00112A1D95|nr:ATP-binding protein [Shewanella sp. SNU WT4]QDF65589.1 response regulator [Shewanella sp. SNU WT4]
MTEMLAIRPRRNIVYKLNLPTIICAICVSIIISILYLTDMKQRIRSQVAHELTDLISTLNLTLEANPSVTNMQQVVATLASKDHINRLSLIDPKTHRILADNHLRYVGEEFKLPLAVKDISYNPSIGLQQFSDVDLMQIDHLEQYLLLHLISPTEQRLRPYVVYVDYDLHELQALYSGLLLTFIMIQLFGFALLLGVNLYIQQKVVIRPITSIRQQIIDNHGTAAIKFSSNDEFESLVNGYNEVIGKRLQQELELESSRRYIDNIAKVLPIQMAYIDQYFHVRFINANYLQWLESELDQVLGQQLSEVLSPYEHGLISAYFTKAMAGDIETFEFECFSKRLQRKEYFQASLIPDIDKQDAVCGVIICIENLSNIKLNEIKIERYAQELEFNNWALSDATEKAEAATRAKSDFLACMSHEIRTPMNGVTGILAILSESELNEQQRHYVALATNSADSLLLLINDILDFSKIESGRFDIEHIAFDFVSLLDGVLQSMSLKAEDKHIKLIYDIGQLRVRWMEGDPNRIRQVLTNIIGNAIKFTEAGWVEVYVTTAVLDDGKLQLLVSIEDTGIGISEQVQATLFSPFTQADSTTTRHFGGTGLGLSIAKRLCELMGGSISLESLQGVGSCFKIQLELGVQAKPQGIWPPQLQGKTIHFFGHISDEERLLVDLFETWGADIKMAALPPNLKQVAHDDNTLAIFYYSHRADNQLHDLITTFAAPLPANSPPVVIAITHQQRVLLKNIDDSYLTLTRPLSLMLLLNVIGLGNNQTRNYMINDDFYSNGTHLLLVEDNKINQIVATGMLQKFGISVDYCNNGVEALVHLSSPDCPDYPAILMDCLMPEMDGYQTTRAIRAGQVGERWLHIPIIAITANAMKGDKEHCLEAGMNDYLSKPLQESEISLVLSRWLMQIEANSVIDINPDKALPMNSQLPPPLSAVAGVKSAGEVFNSAAALRTMSGDKQLLAEVLAMFVLEMQEYEDTVGRSIEHCDFTELRNCTHTIKGVAANLAMPVLSELAKQVELAAKHEDQSLVDVLGPELLQQMRCCIDVARTYDLAG